MSDFDQQNPPPATPPAILRDSPRRRPKPARKPAPRKRLPRAMVLPENQPIEDRDQFIEWVHETWGSFIVERLRYWQVLPESAKDLRQRVLLLVLDKYDERFIPDNMEAYLEVVVHHMARAHRRARGLPIDRGADAEAMADSGDPERDAMFAERVRQVELYFDSLTDAEKEVFEALEVEGKSLDAVAAQFKRSRSTVYDQRLRALEKLQCFVRSSEQAATFAAPRRPET